MKQVKIQDAEISSLGLGTWQLTDRCVEAVRFALDNGYRHVDTAQAYGNEELVGRGIEESDVDREDIWLTTKLWRDNLNQRNLKNSVEESLEKLDTDYVDLLLIHWPFNEMNLEAVIQEMNELVEDGKTRYIGISNFTPEQMEEAQNYSSEKLITNQVEYHLFLNQNSLLETCRKMDMMLTAYSPLARGDVIGNSRLREIGEKYGKSEVQIALRWLIQQENVAAIPKASSREHIRENLEVFDFELSKREMQRIHDLGGNTRKVDPSFAPDWD